MSWRIVSVSNHAYLSLRANNLIIKQDEEFSVPLSDIGVLLLESHAITVSAALLNALVEHKVATFTCDEKHLPTGLLLPHHQHSRQRKAMEQQLSWSEPFKKRLWQRIVIAKLKNQANVVAAHSAEAERKILQYAESVQSGDPLNREATAARCYFEALLPDGVYRGSEHVHNAALNYGYAIIRGALARSIVAYGFLPSLAIKHQNELNNFSLADDLMEPYRPVVDRFVFSAVDASLPALTKETRQELAALLTAPVMLGEQTLTVLRALECTARSLSTASAAKSADELLLPVIA